MMIYWSVNVAQRFCLKIISVISAARLSKTAKMRKRTNAPKKNKADGILFGSVTADLRARLFLHPVAGFSVFTYKNTALANVVATLLECELNK